MARRRPTRTDLKNLVNDQRRRGFEHYCTPYDWEAGRCATGKHGHSADSRHFKGLAVDFGWPGAPISDMERIHVLLEMRRLAADPVIDYRLTFNISDGNHPDHGHVDDNDSEPDPGWYDDFRDRQGVSGP